MNANGNNNPASNAGKDNKQILILKLTIMKTILTNALAAIGSPKDSNVTDAGTTDMTGQQLTPQVKVIEMSRVNKDTANEMYLNQNSTPLMEEGFHDASRSDCSMEVFGPKLELLKNRYIMWCRSHQDLFTDRTHEVMDEYRAFIQGCVGRLAAMDGTIRGMEEKASELRDEIQQVVSRNYKAVDVIKVILNIAVLLALGTWVALYYGSALTLTSCSANDLIDSNGEVIQLFSVQNMVKGWPLALFPLAAGTLAGFLRKSTWTFVAEMGAFMALDIFLSLTVEQKIGQGYAIMDIPYEFDWNRFMLIICYGVVASLFFCESSHALSQNLLLNEYNSKRNAAKEAEVRLKALQERIDAVRRERNGVDGDRLDAENALKRVEEKEIYTYWYDGTTLEGILNSYYDGWARFLTSCPGRKDADKVLEQAREAIRKTAQE